MKRGEIYWADLDPVVGSEQGGVRPVVVIQNNKGNRSATTVIVAALTTREKRPLPVHVPVSAQESGLQRGATVLTEQVRTLEKSRLGRRIGRMTDDAMRRIDRALACALGTEETMKERTDELDQKTSAE